MVKLFLKLLCLGGVVLALLQLVTGYLDSVSTNVFRMEKPFWVMNQRGKSYDFAIIGSSRAENCTDVRTIEEITGKSGVNLGVQGACFADNLIMFRRFWENGNRTRLLLVEVDEYAMDSRNSFLDPFKVHFYLPYLEDRWVWQIVEDNVSSRQHTLWRYLPVSKYVEYNTMYLTYLLQHGLGRRGFDFDKSKGTRLEVNDTPFVFDAEKVKRNKKKGKSIDSKDLKYLNRLLAYAKQNGIEVMLYTAPQYHEQLQYLSNHREFLATMGELSRRYGFQYGNYEYDEIAKDQKMFLDASHLNAEGTVIFSRKLAKRVAAAL